MSHWYKPSKQSMVKVNKDPFSNGTDHDRFEWYNCRLCIKSSEPCEDGTYTNARQDNMPKCAIQRDIFTRMMCDNPISQRTIDICNDFTLNGTVCPMRKTSRPRKHIPTPSNQTSLL